MTRPGAPELRIALGVLETAAAQQPLFTSTCTHAFQDEHERKRQRGISRVITYLRHELARRELASIATITMKDAAEAREILLALRAHIRNCENQATGVPTRKAARDLTRAATVTKRVLDRMERAVTRAG